MYSNSSYRGARASRFFIACAALAALEPGVLRAQAAAEPPVLLEPVIVTATRTPVTASQIGSAFTVIDSSELARRQIRDLGGALNGAAGAPVPSGAAGASSAIFLRGAGSSQTLFLVDGIRFSDANTLYTNFLGGAAALPGDRVEIVRGPQSTLYGADAIGGVIALEAEPISEKIGGVIGAELGSHESASGRVSLEGRQGANAFRTAVAAGTTENERDNNDFEALTTATRIERRIGEATTLGGTVRAYRGDYQSPGANIGFGANDPDNSERETNALATVFLKHAPRDEPLSARLTLGGQHRDQESIRPPAPGSTHFRTRRGVADGQASYRWRETNRLTLGGTVESQRYTTTGSNPLALDSTDYALFVQDEWTPHDRLAFSGGLRRDEFENLDGQTTGRATAAVQAVPGVLKARGSYGTGFRAPSAIDLIGVFPDPFGFGYRGNPDLLPEKSRGWDAGLDVTLPACLGTVGATWFEIDTEDRINGFYFDGSDPAFPFTARNEARSESRGLELSADLFLPGRLRFRGDYTYLLSEDINGATTERQVRRPRHVVNADLSRAFGRLDLGLGAQFVDNRIDFDAVTFARRPAENYAVCRVYAGYSLGSAWRLTARVENLLDEQYAVVNGFPLLGRSVYAGLEWSY